MIGQTFHRETSFQIGREQLEKCAMVSIAQMIELTLTVAVGRSHLRTQEGQAGCMLSGCLARAACPVGAAYRYNGAQLRFHMAALSL